MRMMCRCYYQQHTGSVVLAAVVVPVAIAVRRDEDNRVGSDLNELPLGRGVGSVGAGRHGGA